MAEESLALIAEACKWECYPSSRALIFPGGAIAHFEEFLTHVRMFWPFLSEAQARRMARAYGVMLHEMLGQVRNEADMGRSFGAGFTEIEARWMREHEWAQPPEDFRWRRSKSGLQLTKEERGAFPNWGPRNQGKQQ